MRKKLTILSIGILAIPIMAMAVAAPKYYVCKYVGQPGVDEHLQTGQNPISVSQNAIQDFQGVGSYFNDAQGRSYVLALDTGQEEPSVDECPAVEVPETPPAPQPAPQPTPPAPPNIGGGTGTLPSVGGHGR